MILVTSVFGCFATCNHCISRKNYGRKLRAKSKSRSKDTGNFDEFIADMWGRGTGDQ